MGRTPIPKVAIAMRSMVVASVFVRPMRSASGPKNSPPKGRARNDAANSAAVMTGPPAVPGGRNTTWIVVSR